MEVLRAGLLSPVLSLDPRQDFDAESDLVLRQVFESPYELDSDGQALYGRIFAGQLGPVADSSTAGVLSARVRSGIRFSDGTQLPRPWQEFWGWSLTTCPYCPSCTDRPSWPTVPTWRDSILRPSVCPPSPTSGSKKPRSGTQP